MIEEAITLSLDVSELPALEKRFHLTKEGAALFPLIKRKVEDCLTPRVWIRLKEEEADVLFTLGSGVDDLQQEYFAKKQLTEAYLIDVICMAFLEKGNDVVAKLLHRHTGKYMSTMIFPGDTVPLEEIKDIVDEMKQEVVVCLDSLQLLPQKSTAFRVTLTDSGVNQCTSVCVSCSKTDCPNRSNRNMTYGYQRIYGNRTVLL